MDRALVVIPARFASVRLPGKPLLKETGKYLIQHVAENAMRCRSATRVIVATDDERIAEAVASFGGEAAMTARHHVSGTDRVAEVARSLGPDAPGIVVNVQGDEPELRPDQIDRLVEALASDADAAMATLAVEAQGREAYLDPNVVKVVCGGSGRALYFSRAPIPFSRDGAPDDVVFLKHIGVYAYRHDALLEISSLPPGRLEAIERLEQLRALEAGYGIKVAITDFEPHGIDTPAGYAAFVRSATQDTILPGGA